MEGEGERTEEHSMFCTTGNFSGHMRELDGYSLSDIHWY